MLVLSYIPLLSLIPLLGEKEDPELQWHAKHGLVLTVMDIIVMFAFMIVNFALNAAGLDCLGCITYLLTMLALFALHIACIVKAVGGQRLIIPGVSQYADRF
ncbi:MAG: hypothetical protein SX243_20810 [Acidobacteriota bacterium]|nr:hypothetical protein [Acidobacteriota bacterium]